MRARELWRVPPEHLEQAQDDATILAIRDMERAGIDIITDGEIRRESYSNHFATALEGIDLEQPGEIARPQRAARCRCRASSGRSAGAARSRCATSSSCARTPIATIKITLPGPFTMAQQAQNEYYARRGEPGARDYAAAVNEELHDLFAAGADVVQIDEPWLQARPGRARARYGVRGDQPRAGGRRRHDGAAPVLRLRGAREGQAASGYSFLPSSRTRRCSRSRSRPRSRDLDLGVLDELSRQDRSCSACSTSATAAVETPERVAERIRAALEHRPPERLIVAPDCGMKYLPRDVAFGKLEALAGGARVVRAEH